MSSLNIAVCGGGNGAHACAALLTMKGHRVRIFSPITSEIETFRQNYQKNGGLDAIVEGKEYPKIQLGSITDDPSQAISQASVIFVIVPSFAHKPMFRHIAAHMNPNALVVVLPCRGLVELELREFLPNASVMAFQTLPWACRIEKPGSRINIKGVKRKIQAACRPASMSDINFHLLEELLDMKIERVHSMLTMTLANIGQIFHPGIMYGQFKSDPNRIFSETDIPLFYQGVTAEGADILQLLADEVHNIGVKLCEYDPEIELDKVLSPKDWLMESYCDQIKDTSSLQTMLNSNAAYQGIKIPVKKVRENQYCANFKARYVVEDVPYSLLVTRSLGEIAGVPTPMMDEVISGLGSWIGCDYLQQLHIAKQLGACSRLPVFYGCETIADLLK